MVSPSPEPCRGRTPHRFGILIILIVFLKSAFPFPGNSEEILKIGGTGSALGTVQLLAQAFEKSHPGVTVRLVPSLGSTGGIKAVRTGTLHIGLSGRPLKNDERGPTLFQKAVAKTPLIFVGHEGVKKEDLSTKELVEMYSGKKQNWPDGKRLRLIMRPRTETDMVLIRGISKEMDQAVEKALCRKGLLVGLTNQESNLLVETTPGALGISGLSEWLSEKRSYRVFSFNGVIPSVPALEKGTYPLAKSLFFILPARMSPAARKFVAFVASQEGREILLANGNMASDEDMASK
jgi:phosphate transport system substrate-binding protein